MYDFDSAPEKNVCTNKIAGAELKWLRHPKIITELKCNVF